MTSSPPAPENATHGLTAIGGEHDVVVTGEEYHQDALRPYTPRADGRARRVAVELVPAPIARGTHAGQPGIEVRLDGHRVGELTATMAQRYGPLVVDVLRRGGRPACIGKVGHGKRGLEMVLQLPVHRAGAVPPPVAPPGLAATAARRRRPVLVGAGVVLLLVVIVASLNGGDPATVPTAAPATIASAPTTTPAPPTSTVPPATPVALETQPPAPPQPQPQAQPQRQAQPQPQPQAQPQPRPQPQPQPQPQPEPRPQPQPEPQPAVRQQPPPPADPEPTSDCNSNYSGCVPNASDVDCEGGSGNGPAYVSGSVRVTGDDVYRLDNDKDGMACE